MPTTGPDKPPESHGSLHQARGVLSESAARLGGRVAGGALSLLALHEIVRYLGAARWGEVAAASAWVAIFAALGELGMATAGARDLDAGDPHHRGVLGATYLVGIAGAVVAAGVAIALGSIAFSGRIRLAHLVLLAAPLCPFSVVWVIAATLLAAHGRSGLRGLLDFSSSALLLVVAVVVADEHLSPGAYVVGSVLTVVVTAVIALVMVQISCGLRPDWRASVGELRGRFLTVKTIGVVTVIGLVYRYIDTVLVALRSNSAQVAQYAVAYQLVGFVMSLPVIVLGTSVQRYVRAEAKARRELMQYLVNLLVVPLLPGIVLLALLAPWILRLVAGRTGSAAQSTFLLLLGATVLLWLAVPFMSGLIWSGNEKLAAIVAVSALAVNVASNLALDGSFGARGGAIAMIASEATSAVSAVVLYVRRVGFTFRARMPLAGVGGAALIGGIWAALRLG